VLGSGTYRMGPRALALARSQAAGIVPYRARIARVSIGARVAADPSAYTAIMRRPSITPPGAIWRARSMPIGLMFAAPSPWADWDSARYFPSARLLHIPDGAWVRVSSAEAAMIAADAHPSPPSRGRGLAAPIAIALAACTAVLIAAARRRPGWRLRGA
jgi:hypothetical protein